MSSRCKSTERRALTLLELLVAMTIVTMVVAALGGLARTVEQGFEYGEGYGTATQHARVILDRIAQNVRQATANDQFPGCFVVPTFVGSHSYPETLVIWRPNGVAADPAGLPRYNELVIYCPHPTQPNQLVEITAPTDTRTVPPISVMFIWRSELAALKQAPGTKTVALSTLLRTCSTAASGGGSPSDFRGAVRFEARLRPSADDWTQYKSGTVTWMNLPWVQGIYGSQTGLRQVGVRTELQLMPSEQWTASNPDSAIAAPFLGSAALYYKLSHP